MFGTERMKAKLVSKQERWGKKTQSCLAYPRNCRNKHFSRWMWMVIVMKPEAEAIWGKAIRCK